MNKWILALALTASSSAFAYVCEVDMVDNRTRRVIQTFRVNDYDNTCKEGMKQCRLEIRQSGRYGQADCIQRKDRYPNPQPNPYPYPNPNPNPYPDTGYDVRRPLGVGELVYYNARQATVSGIGYNNNYVLTTTDVFNNRIQVRDVRREQIAVTSGCNRTACVNDSVISLTSNSAGRDATVVALTYDDKHVIRTTDIFNNPITVTSVDRSQLANTRPGSCVYAASASVCIGDRVINSSNREGTVIGIHMYSTSGDRVVLRTTDVFNNPITQINVDPRSLYLTRGRY